jgi:hypothetical protein
MGTNLSEEYAASIFWVEVLPKHSYSTTGLHYDTTQKVTILIFTPMNTSDLVHDDKLFLN